MEGVTWIIVIPDCCHSVPTPFELPLSNDQMIANGVNLDFVVLMFSVLQSDDLVNY